MFSRL
ncbi:hypothetical protein VCCP104417_2636, partial [Vibrio cholerae CP1044(17)]